MAILMQSQVGPIAVLLEEIIVILDLRQLVTGLASAGLVVDPEIIP